MKVEGTNGIVRGVGSGGDPGDWPIAAVFIGN